MIEPRARRPAASKAMKPDEVCRQGVEMTIYSLLLRWEPDSPSLVRRGIVFA
ncbi:hypothetical protein GCM10011499_30330 [Pelagibacterium lentulum]|uniref:Uncharacterized protein n=1 Tax=Pelagibacterium lentulum TaxID=2029865 RepID=A0A916W0R6_9HYPH|nr:hypothetical protein GCM10011499_30330 [Pelagibacterium lentulum]